MASRRVLVGWFAVATLLLGLAIPWFLWGDDTRWLGLPVWMWWHVSWLVLAAGVFYVFTTRYWGLGVTGGERS